MDPAEMLVDPTFTYNTGLPDVSNVHRARAEILCDPLISVAEAPVRLTLPDGTRLRFDMQEVWNGRVLTADEAGPAAERVEMLGENGPGTVLKSFRGEIRDALEPRIDDETTGGADCAGCGASGPAGSLLALVGLALLRRRRR
jgi:uncharacterized protein (TIGR03382 family)